MTVEYQICITLLLPFLGYHHCIRYIVENLTTAFFSVFLMPCTDLSAQIHANALYVTRQSTSSIYLAECEMFLLLLLDKIYIFSYFEQRISSERITFIHQ